MGKGEHDDIGGCGDEGTCCRDDDGIWRTGSLRMNVVRVVRAARVKFGRRATWVYRGSRVRWSMLMRRREVVL